jgi:Protein  of unknown function (DUF3018)
MPHIQFRLAVADPTYHARLRATQGADFLPRAVRTGTTDKFQRYRARRKADGMKLVRIWVPDPRSPDVAARALREAESLRGAPDEQEAMHFIEAAMRDLDFDV